MGEPEDDKIKELILSKKMQFSDRVLSAIENMNLQNPDFTITSVGVSFWGPHDNNRGGIGIDWNSVSAGCGRADFYIDSETGKLRCYNQGMGKEFLKSLLLFVLENTELDDDKTSN